MSYRRANSCWQREAQAISATLVLHFRFPILLRISFIYSINKFILTVVWETLQDSLCSGITAGCHGARFCTGEIIQGKAIGTKKASYPFTKISVDLGIKDLQGKDLSQG